MDWRRSDDSAEHFSAYLGELASVIGHAARVGPLRDYCSGLLLECERKSVEPIAAATAPHATGARHQSLLHFLAKGEWSDAKVLGKVREPVLPQIERHGPIEAWVIDDTGFPKCGSRRVAPILRRAWQAGQLPKPAPDPDPGSPFRCRLPIMWRAFPSPVGFMFPRAGRATRRAAKRPAFLRTSSFKPSRKLRFNRSLSTLPEDIDFARMIDITMMRWRIVPKARFQHDERDYQDLKQEVGLGHFEG